MSLILQIIYITKFKLAENHFYETITKKTQNWHFHIFYCHILRKLEPKNITLKDMKPNSWTFVLNLSTQWLSFTENWNPLMFFSHANSFIE